jgi:hypothetical protein
VVGVLSIRLQHTSSETIHDVVLGIPDASIWDIDPELCPVPPGKEY